MGVSGFKAFIPLQVNLDIDKFLEEMDEADKEMPIGDLGLHEMDHVKVSDQPAPLSTSLDKEVSESSGIHFHFNSIVRNFVFIKLFGIASLKSI